MRNKLTISNQHKWILILSFFGIIYSLISLFNHINFRTYSLDLGAYTNAIYDYAHFQWNDSTVFKKTSENLLSDHFDFYLIFFSPLVYIFKSYTLLIIQIFFVLIGGLGVKKYFDLKDFNNYISISAASYFLLFFGIFSALSYDYHSNVIAACMVPWFFYWVKRGTLIKASLCCLFIIIGKENMSLWMAFISLGLLIENRTNKTLRIYLLAVSSFSLISFILITGYIMPAFSNNGTYPHFHYSILGDSSSEALKNILLHPIESIKILFTNHLDSSSGDYIKLESHLFLAICGLPILLFKPHYLLMLIPIYVQKFFHDNYLLWSVAYQYSVEFAPIFAIGIFSVIGSIKKSFMMKIATVGVLILALACTIRLMDKTEIFTNKNRLRIYKSSHYSRDFNVQQMHKCLQLIPQTSAVSATRTLVPHLALRESIYEYPIVKNAEFLVLSKFEDQENLLDKKPWLNTAVWETIINDEGIILLKRK